MKLAEHSLFQETQEASKLIAAQYEFVRVFSSEDHANIEAGRGDERLAIYIDAVGTVKCNFFVYELNERGKAKNTKALLKGGTLIDMKVALSKLLEEAA